MSAGPTLAVNCGVAEFICGDNRRAWLTWCVGWPDTLGMMKAGTVMARGETWLEQWRHGAKAHPLTQAECAAAVGISRSRWSEIEAGAACFMETALKIQAFTGIAPADFHKRSKWRRTETENGRRKRR